MRVYVAGALDDIDAVRAAQGAVVDGGHELVWDWTRGLDIEAGASEADPTAIAVADLDAVMVADAVLVLPGAGAGRGLFVELGAALARAARGEQVRIGVLGEHRQSVFLSHPLVELVADAVTWLAQTERADER